MELTDQEWTKVLAAFRSVKPHSPHSGDDLTFLKAVYGVTVDPTARWSEFGPASTPGTLGGRFHRLTRMGVMQAFYDKLAQSRLTRRFVAMFKGRPVGTFPAMRESRRQTISPRMRAKFLPILQARIEPILTKFELERWGTQPEYTTWQDTMVRHRCRKAGHLFQVTYRYLEGKDFQGCIHCCPVPSPGRVWTPEKRRKHDAMLDRILGDHGMKLISTRRVRTGKKKTLLVRIVLCLEHGHRFEANGSWIMDRAASDGCKRCFDPRLFGRSNAAKRREEAFKRLAEVNPLSLTELAMVRFREHTKMLTRPNRYWPRWWNAAK